MKQKIKDKRNLTEGPVAQQILSLSAPMIIGIVSIILFSLADAYFVSLLGDEPFAALGYGFPILNIYDSVGIGLGVGITAITAQKFGSGDEKNARLIMIVALNASFIFGLILAVIGIVAIEPLFRFLGADGTVLELVRDYMEPAYIAAGSLFLPLAVNFGLRGHGEFMVPSILMIISAILNAGLDPLLIFGWGFVPGYGIAGAAYASIISRVIIIITGLAYLNHRYAIFKYYIESFSVIKPAIKAILIVGIPAIFANSIAPLATTAVTKILSGFGDSVVAAYGLALRVEILTWAPIFGLSAGSAAFFGQNYGANNQKRIRKAYYFTVLSGLIWALAAAAILFIIRDWIALQFTSNPDVIRTINLYLAIVPIGYLGFALVPVSAAKLNSPGYPMRALIISIIQYFVILTPLTYILSKAFDVSGAFFGIMAGHLLGGVMSYALVRHLFIKNRYLNK